jgi:peptidyl-prolyl cis-trans isomerase C
VYDADRHLPPVTVRLPVDRASPRTLLRDPLLHFVLLGMATWAIVKLCTFENTSYVIDLGSGEQQRLAAAYSQQFGQQPSPSEFQELFQRYIREEVFLREGLRLKLDQNDEIVRRRVIQKYEFLLNGATPSPPPEPARLEAWFRRNEQRYMTPARVAFHHVYFSADQGRDAEAKARAATALRELRGGRHSPADIPGDDFPGPSIVRASARDELTRLFGRTELVEQLFSTAEGEWTGPYRSGFGWHIVYVEQRAPAVLQPFPEIRGRVLEDYLEEQRRQAEERAFEKLRVRYSVRYGDVAR